MRGLDLEKYSSTTTSQLAKVYCAPYIALVLPLPAPSGLNAMAHYLGPLRFGPISALCFSGWLRILECRGSAFRVSSFPFHSLS